MLRWSLAFAAAFLVAACGARATGKQSIEARCLRDAGDERTCACLARESDRRLGDAMFELVVLAAQGGEEMADEELLEFPPEDQLKFTQILSEITAVCDTVGPTPPG